MMDTTLNIGVVGCGYWGPNLIRNAAGLPGVSLRALCDLDEKRLNTISNQYNPTYKTTQFDDLLEDEELSALIIATSAITHYDLAKAALEAGKHVLVEKPITLQTAHATELVAIAKANQRCLMVGHTFQYNPAVNKVRQLIADGELGDIIYAYLTRVNLGIIRDDLNVMWNLAPHDISILLYTFQRLPIRVSAHGFSPLRPNNKLEDIVFIVLEFADGAVAHVHVSWIDPNKIRKATFVGTKKMVVYDDVDAQRPIQIFDKGVVHQETPASFGEFKLTIREGDILIPKIATTEPLRAEVQHFVDCVKTGKTPISDGINGWQVLRVMEAADQSVEQHGAPVDINWEDMPQ